MKDLLEAIYSKWDLDTPLFFVEAPQVQDFPYVLVVPISSDPEYTLEDASDSYLIQISVFSDKNTATEAMDIGKEVFGLFDDATLSIPGKKLVRCQREQSRIIRDDSVWHYIIEYEILLHR